MSRLRSVRFTRPFEVASDDSIRADSDGERNLIPRQTADWSSMADDEVLRGELRQSLAKALPSLPAIYRLPVLLRDVQGLSTEEAAAILRIKTETLKSRLHRGRLMLRDHLAEFAGGLTLRRQM
jgi:RNA polymerase sigma-70 factor (ECF subfamily)